MFAGFKLEGINKSFFDTEPKDFYEYIEIGKNHLEQNKAKCKTQLEQFIVYNDVIDGSALQDNWFPTIKADIFISHSHRDKDLALALSGWLNDTFGLQCFVDSVVWGYSNDLIKLLYKKTIDTNEHPYRIESSEILNKVTQHVNMMLNIALHRMIDNTEAIFLLNTSNATSLKVTSGVKEVTYSPWIYSEIVCSEIVRKKTLSEYRKKILTEFAHSDLLISYDLYTEHLITIRDDKLVYWRFVYQLKEREYALDIIYDLYARVGGGVFVRH